MDPKQQVLDYLNGQSIPFDLVEHPAVYTIEEVLALGLPQDRCIAKNLFLRNFNGKSHYILVVEHSKTVDLKALRRQIGSSHLGFASEDRLMTHLGLHKGEVTPLGILNNSSCTVEVLLDEDLFSEEVIGVHPNTNTATVFLSPQHLEQAIMAHGNPVRRVKID